MKSGTGGLKETRITARRVRTTGDCRHLFSAPLADSPLPLARASGAPTAALFSWIVRTIGAY